MRFLHIIHIENLWRRHCCCHSYVRELLHGVTRHLEIGNFLVYDRLNYELAIIVALKGIAFSSFLAYLIIY